MYADEAYVLEALRSGATGYILKEAHADDLIEAVLRVASGNRYLSQPLTERAIDAYMQRAEEGAADALYALTDREREVLLLAASGHTSAQIATMLTISPRTAETHRANLMKKLGLRNQVELLRFATERGLLLPPAVRAGATAQKLR
jgi:DNA-binding NarL/FixJ family response regulator